jgi:hypothetical protein
VTSLVNHGAQKINFTVNESISNLIVAIGITDVHDYPIATTGPYLRGSKRRDYVARFTEKLVNYNTGNYKLIVGISEGYILLIIL